MKEILTQLFGEAMTDEALKTFNAEKWRDKQELKIALKKNSRDYIDNAAIQYPSQLRYRLFKQGGRGGLPLIQCVREGFASVKIFL